jgi:hypothetical protein
MKTVQMANKAQLFKFHDEAFDRAVIDGSRFDAP